eukprot:TRINITY_DN9513_c0_g1_i1.p1 TRINITY_DN9513_c0_g1~~TRINITY_DN9513_c0_g1_i1.p1  ORF type:complete len:107 (-),score=0.98 TRINITY_DN9513_c0_g1_i1:96-416(-)
MAAWMHNSDWERGKEGESKKKGLTPPRIAGTAWNQYNSNYHSIQGTFSDRGSYSGNREGLIHAALVTERGKAIGGDADGQLPRRPRERSKLKATTQKTSQHTMVGS